MKNRKMKALKIKDCYRRAKRNRENFEKILQNLRVFPLKEPSRLAMKRAIYQSTAWNVRKLPLPNTIRNKQNPAYTRKVRDKGLRTNWEGSSRCHFRNIKTNGPNAFEIVRENNAQPRTLKQLSHQSRA